MKHTLLPFMTKKNRLNANVFFMLVCSFLTFIEVNGQCPQLPSTATIEVLTDTICVGSQFYAQPVGAGVDVGNGQWIVFADECDGIMYGNGSDSVPVPYAPQGKDSAVYYLKGDWGSNGGMACPPTDCIRFVVRSEHGIPPIPDSTRLPNVVDPVMVVIPEQYSELPTATNACGRTIRGSIPHNVSPNLGDTLTAPGVYVVSWVYDDEDGNDTTQVQKFIVGSESDTATLYVSLISICEGDSIELEGAYRTEPGDYIDTYIAASGGDSIVTTTLSFIPAIDVPTPEELLLADILYLNTTPVDGVNAYQWLDCGDGYTPLTGPTTNTHSLDLTNFIGGQSSNNFALEISHDCGADTTICYEYVPAGIDALASGSFGIHPNPVKDDLTLTWTNQSSGNELNVSIYNHVGEKVFTKLIALEGSIYTLDVRSLDSGIYTVTLSDKLTSVTRNFVVMD